MADNKENDQTQSKVKPKAMVVKVMMHRLLLLTVAMAKTTARHHQLMVAKARVTALHQLMVEQMTILHHRVTVGMVAKGMIPHHLLQKVVKVKTLHRHRQKVVKVMARKVIHRQSNHMMAQHLLLIQMVMLMALSNLYLKAAKSPLRGV